MSELEKQVFYYLHDWRFINGQDLARYRDLFTELLNKFLQGSGQGTGPWWYRLQQLPLPIFDLFQRYEHIPYKKRYYELSKPRYENGPINGGIFLDFEEMDGMNRYYQEFVCWA